MLEHIGLQKILQKIGCERLLSITEMGKFYRKNLQSVSYHGILLD